MGRCGIRSCRFSQRLKQISKHELAISLAVRKQICIPIRLQVRVLKSVLNVVKSGKSESRIVPCKNLINLQTFLVVFFVLQICFTR